MCRPFEVFIFTDLLVEFRLEMVPLLATDIVADPLNLAGSTPEAGAHEPCHATEHCGVGLEGEEEPDTPGDCPTQPVRRR